MIAAKNKLMFASHPLKVVLAGFTKLQAILDRKGISVYFQLESASSGGRFTRAV
jgi:hypothetical protein